MQLNPLAPKYMKIPAKSLTQLVLSTVAGIGLVSLLAPQPSWAQVDQVNPLQDFDSQEESGDPFSDKTSEVDSFGVFDLMHRAQLGTNRSFEDYSAEQNQSLDAAAAQFRERQRKLIQGQGEASSVNSDSTPQTGN